MGELDPRGPSDARCRGVRCENCCCLSRNAAEKYYTRLRGTAGAATLSATHYLEQQRAHCLLSNSAGTVHLRSIHELRRGGGAKECVGESCTKVNDSLVGELQSCSASDWVSGHLGKRRLYPLRATSITRILLPSAILHCLSISIAFPVMPLTEVTLSPSLISMLGFP